MLGEILKELRKRSGVAVEEIRKTLKISKATYYNWEEERSLPNEEQISKLAELFAERLLSEKKEDIEAKLFEAMKIDMEKIIKPKGRVFERKKSFRKPAENLTADLYSKKISPGVLAEKTGIDPERISDFLVGLLSPTPEEAGKIADFFGTSPERYLDFVDEEVLHMVLAKNKRIKDVFMQILALEERKKQVILEIIEKFLSLEEE